MNRLFPLIVALALYGCDSIIVQPTNLPDKTKPAPVVPVPVPAKADFSQQTFFEMFAEHVEKGHIDHTQRVFKVASDVMQDHKLTPPADWDTTMKPFTDKNVFMGGIDDPTRKKIVATLRKWAQ